MSNQPRVGSTSEKRIHLKKRNDESLPKLGVSDNKINTIKQIIIKYLTINWPDFLFNFWVTKEEEQK